MRKPVEMQAKDLETAVHRRQRHVRSAREQTERKQVGVICPLTVCLRLLKVVLNRFTVTRGS